VVQLGAPTGTATITEWNPATDKPAGPPDQPAQGWTVDFDPQSLQLTYTVLGNQGTQGTKGRVNTQKSVEQWTGQTTTLTVSLLFDSSTTSDSVQTKTERLVQLTLGGNPTARVRPSRVLRFHWGTFTFVGSIQSMTETIDYFSEQGVPLRATVNLTLQEVAPPSHTASAAPTAPNRPFGASIGGGPGSSATAGSDSRSALAVGSTPVTVSQAGDTVQGMTARAGLPVSWKTVAAANGIENPRLLPPGTVINLDVSAPAALG
jgi:hypothetical protein